MTYKLHKKKKKNLYKNLIQIIYLFVISFIFIIV